MQFGPDASLQSAFIRELVKPVGTLWQMLSFSWFNLIVNTCFLWPDCTLILSVPNTFCTIHVRILMSF